MTSRATELRVTVNGARGEWMMFESEADAQARAEIVKAGAAQVGYRVQVEYRDATEFTAFPAVTLDAINQGTDRLIADVTGSVVDRIAYSLARMPLADDADAETRATHIELRKQFGMNPDLRKPGLPNQGS